jgi:hypothetical protein
LNNTSLLHSGGNGFCDEEQLEDLHYFFVAFFQKKHKILQRIEEGTEEGAEKNRGNNDSNEQAVEFLSGEDLD